MPGTTRYSATFDRTYEEDDRVDPPQPTNARRSRSQSWQANSGLDGRPYTPLGGRPLNQRSSSTDSGPSKVPDHIPTRTVANTAVKAHNNPFQFVKVGTCPLYKKAEEQLKKTKEVKKQDVLKEEEEEWQSNLDSWKSRRRKMSEDVFRRQEEIKQFELEEQQISQVSQKKTKTFSEMVESRAHRGRTLSLCLLSSPLEFKDWEYENKNHKNGSSSTFTDESEENSTVNSEDEGVSLRGRPGRPSHHDNQNNHRTNGDAHIEQNGSKLVTHNGDYNKLADLTTNNVQMKPKEGSYIDSGLESISSSHRAGDTPDSCSDFSQDSNSSIDCDSPRTGVNILEEFSSKSLQMSPGQEVTIKLNLLDKTQELGFTFQGGKDAGQVCITSVLKGSEAESSGIQLGDQIITVDGSDISSKTHTEITSMVQKGQEKGEINILLWRHSKTANGFKSNEKHVDENTAKPNKTESQNAKSDSQHYEKSIESENEMYVDDFEELQRQSELLTSSNKSETTNMNSQAHSKGKISPSSVSSYKDSIKTSSAPKLNENITNGAIDEKNKSEKNDSELNTENQKKNIVKVKRVRKKGVYALDVSGAPNQIPQEGIPVNFLYPLSPVTELPSPAEETKTMSSALSSNPTNSVSNSQNGIFLKETLKEAEVKLISSTIKENNKTTATAPTFVTSKTTIPSDESRPSDKTESKFDSTNVPSSPIFPKNKNISLESSHEESPKVPSSPKKVKVKVKKANTSSDQKSDSPQVAKEIPSNSVTQTDDLSVQKLTAEGQHKKEQASSSLTNDKKVKANENVECCQKKESNILSTESSTVTPVAKSSLKDNTSASVASISVNKTKNLSLKIDTKTDSMNLPSSSVANTKQPKTPTGEKSKSPLAPKKEKIKLKENNISSADSNGETVSDVGRNLPVKIDAQCQSVNLTTPPVANAKQPKTPIDEKSKPPFAQKKEKAKPKGKITELVASDSPQVTKEPSNSSVSCTSPITNVVKESQSKKEVNSTSLMEDKRTKSMMNKSDNSECSSKREKDTGIITVIPEAKSTSSNAIVASSSASSDKTKNLSLKIETLNESVNLATTHPVANSKQPKTPQDEKSKPSFAQKKEKIKSKENSASSAGTVTVIPELKSTASKDKISVTNPTSVADKIRNLTLKIDVQDQSVNIAATPPVANVMQPKTPGDEKSKPPFAQKKENTKSKNTNSQKVNSPAKQNEELSNSNFDSLNIVFQSEPKNVLSETQFINVKHSENNSNRKAVTDLVPDIPPVEKVAEEMEKLILEQLEEEERAKELASELQTKSAVGSPEHLLIAPPKLVEPPKEKPPPPPSTNEGSQKDSSLKRVNSTKRIKKEIHKRRSNFLGIDNADESIVCVEPSIPPPPALEEILKAEMELDRQSRLKIESASTERLTMEEKEIMQKEKEIIESLESEERRKQLLNGIEDFKNVASAAPSDVVFEEDRILSLKNERKRIETERFLTEEQQQLHLLEEKQLREREEFIRKQEAGKSAGPHSDPSLSVIANAPNNSKPVLSSLTKTKSKVSLSDTNGDGKIVTSKSSAEISENKSSECDEKDKVPEKPAVPPKPLKKKEAIRKERERLRQEQEALQREREEHRRKLVLEQEELIKHQKSHAPDAPVSRLGPLPPLVPPNFPPQLTTTMNATPNARESASFPSRSHNGAPNCAVGSSNAVELMGPPIVRQNRTPASRKAVQNEAWGQQKMPSVRKQNHDSLTESRYNQNHWLIQEAEMRRITELKERQQRVTQLPCSQTHLAEDDVCSTPPRVPVIPPPHNPHLNYAVQDKMWNYGQSNMTPKKYPSPAIKDPLHTVYPRETVSQQPPTKPSRVVPMERQEQMLSVSGRKRCSHCNEELGRGAAMIIESLQLYYHIHCFQCCVCQAQLGNGSCGTDVRVRNNKLHCHNCYSNDEAGLKFSQV